MAGAEVQFLRRRFRRLPRALVSHQTAPAGGLFIGSVLAGVVAIDGRGQHAEAVLHGKRDAASLVILQLGHTDEDIGIFVGMIQIVGGKKIAAARHCESRILLALAQRVGVFEFHARRRRQQLAHVPPGIEHDFFERPAGGPGAFHEADAPRACLPHQVSRGAHQLRMHVVRDAGGRPSTRSPGLPVMLSLTGYGLAPHHGIQAAELVEHAGQSAR